MANDNTLVRIGRVWKFGDGINTDLIMPNTVFRLAQADWVKAAFQAIRPNWSSEVREGDILIGGQNFGVGSGRPVGSVLRGCGIAGLVAESVNGLCLRNCVNFGLPALDCPGVSELFEEGDTARIDFMAGVVENQTRGRSLTGCPLPQLLADTVMAGGVMPMLIQHGYVEKTPTNAAAS